ncbi:MAG: metallophosphoesterase, partial [Candidatus Kapaibacterium sp.]
FIITSSLLMLAVDVYVLAAWNRFVRRRAWRPAIRHASWALCIVMAVVSPTISFARSNHARLDDLGYALFIASTVWYFPKIPIMLVLLVNDLVRGVRALVRRVKRLMVRTKETSAAVTETVPDSGRRAALQTTAWSLASVPFVMVARGIDNTDNITVMRETLEIPKLGAAFDGIRIVQISDLHAGSWRSSKPLEETRRLIAAEKPDILVITGDFVNFHPEELKNIRADLERLRAPLGVYASLGNHDHYMNARDHALLRSVVSNCGIRLLVNENQVFEEGSDRLQLASIDNTGLGQDFGDLPRALVGTRPDAPTILLAHDPTFWDKEVLRRRDIELTLSGHTHGGQVGVNVFGTEFSVAQLVYKRWAGLYAVGDQQLYVNRGLGTIGPPMRIGIPPEITSFTLKKRAPLYGAGNGAMDDVARASGHY